MTTSTLKKQKSIKIDDRKIDCAQWISALIKEPVPIDTFENELQKGGILSKTHTHKRKI